MRELLFSRDWFALRVVAACVIVGGVGVAVACGAPDSGRVTVVDAPSYNLYKKYVDKYLDRRCGTLDCHGQAGRGLRLYGVFGLRLYSEDVKLVSGVQDTIEDEKYQNYLSVIGLEPEELNRVVANDPSSNPRKLLLIKKPLNLEGGGENHKGGTVMAPNDEGEKCLIGWLTTPPEETDLDPAVRQACTVAADVR
jgi:hypothetical protein